MNVWIFALSALFTSIIEPMGLEIGAAEDESALESVMTPTSEQAMRYRGIEQLFDELDTDDTP